MKQDRILRPNQVCERLGCTRTTLWRRERDDPNMPKKVRLGPNSVGFRESEIDAYISELPLAAGKDTPA